MKRLPYFFAALFALSLAWPASAATLAPGDLIKLADDGNPATTADSAVYYYGTDSRRYVFPNAQTYFTWYKDFSTVKTVTSAEMAAAQIGGNVTYRPGTRLVKITSDPNVYAVEPGGKLRWIQSEAVALALYGPQWSQRVDDIPDAFFFNYSITEPLAAAVYPDGTVLKRASDNAYFLIENRQKRRIASVVIKDALRIQDKDVITVSADLGDYPNGSDITTAELKLTDTAQKNLIPVTATPTFTVRLPATNYVAVGGEATLLELRFSSVKAAVIKKLTTKIDATTGAPAAGADDLDKGGLVYENNARANLTDLRLVDAIGVLPFGRKDISLNIAQDQSQTFIWTGNFQVAGGQETVLYLRTNLNPLLPTGEGYKVTLVVSGTEVADAATGAVTPFAPAADLVGPTLASLNAALEVSPASNPGSKTFIKGAKDAALAGLTFKATTVAPTVIKSVIFQGYVDEEGVAGFLPGADADNGTETRVRDMVPAVSLYDDKGVKIAGPATVDLAGQAAFSGLSYQIPAGQSAILILKGDLSSTIDLENQPNRLTFDIADASTDLAVVDDKGAKVNALGITPNGGTVPIYYATIKKNGQVKFKWQGNGGPAYAGKEMLLGTLAVEVKDDSYDLTTLSFRQNSGIATSLVEARLEYPVAGAANGSITREFLGSNLIFSALPIVLDKDKVTTLKLYGKFRSKDGGAIYNENIRVQFGNVDSLQFISRTDWQVFSETDLTATGDFSVPTNTASACYIRFSKLTAAKTEGVTGSVYRDSQVEVLRFSLKAEPEGPARISKLVFKLMPGDAGKAGAANDALENWARMNGDFADDDLVANLNQIFASSKNTIGEDSSARIYYSVVHGGVKNSTPIASNYVSAAGDYALLEYVFDQGSEFTVAAGATAQMSLELATASLNGDQDSSLGVELRGGADFLWTDIVSGYYTALNGSEAAGLPISISLTIKK
jgi:hypothetical protein